MVLFMGLRGLEKTEKHERKMNDRRSLKGRKSLNDGKSLNEYETNDHSDRPGCHVPE